MPFYHKFHDLRILVADFCRSHLPTFSANFFGWWVDSANFFTFRKYVQNIPHICHKVHKWEMWRQICHVEKFQISIHGRCREFWNYPSCGEISPEHRFVCNLRCFVTIGAFLRGENFRPKLYMWIKMTNMWYGPKLMKFFILSC